MRRVAARHSVRNMTENGSAMAGIEEPVVTAPPSGGNESDDDNSGDENGTSDIKTEQLIAEVKVRPIIYHHEKIQTQQNSAWEEVAKTLFQSQWDTYGPQRQNEVVKKVQRKWHKIKDIFVKSHGRVDKTSKAKNKSYFSSMTFLIEDPVPPQVQNMEPDQMHGCEAFDPRRHCCQRPPPPSTAQEEENPNIYFSRMLVPLLSTMSREEQFSLWGQILRLINEKQTADDIGVLGEPLVDPVLVNIPGPSFIQESEEHNIQADQAPTSEGDNHEIQSIRPVNPDGELIYPETDHEDDDV